ncbi:MAG: hypothetical protein ACJ8G2_03170 [Burkholderiales bacterium]|jgi:hypothetical protein
MNDYRKASRKAMARADKVSERMIFWGMVSTFIVISLAMLKGML